MTNSDAAAAVFRLAGFYWLFTGLIEVISALGQLMMPMPTNMAWVHEPSFILLVIAQASAYPLAGAVLFFKAHALSLRWTSKPDELAPAIIKFSTGTALLGIYFLVRGLHGVTAPAQRWIVAAQFQTFQATALIEATVYLGAGALLLLRPRWVRLAATADTP